MQQPGGALRCTNFKQSLYSVALPGSAEWPMHSFAGGFARTEGNRLGVYESAPFLDKSAIVKE